MRYSAVLFILLVAALFVTTGCFKKEVPPTEVPPKGDLPVEPATIPPEQVSEQGTGLIDDDVNIGDVI